MTTTLDLMVTGGHFSRWGKAKRGYLAPDQILTERGVGQTKAYRCHWCFRWHTTST